MPRKYIQAIPAMYLWHFFSCGGMTFSSQHAGQCSSAIQNQAKENVILKQQPFTFQDIELMLALSFPLMFPLTYGNLVISKCKFQQLHSEFQIEERNGISVKKTKNKNGSDHVGIHNHLAVSAFLCTSYIQGVPIMYMLLLWETIKLSKLAGYLQKICV